MTASTGSTIVKLYNGCVISLAPNQAVTIDSSLDCKSLIASIQSTGAGPVTAGAVGVGVGGSSGLAAALVGGFGVAMILDSNSENSNPPQSSSGS